MVFARTHVVRNIAELASFVSKQAVEGCSCLKQTHVRCRLVSLGTDLGGEYLEGCVVRSQHEMLILHAILRCNRSVASAEHFIII